MTARGRIHSVADLLLVVEDLVLSPMYLFLFIKPLRHMRKFSAGVNSEHGSMYTAVILRNTLASASSTIITAAFLGGYISVANAHRHDFGVYYQQFFNMLKATDLFCNCLTMFVCTSSLWTISKPTLSVSAVPSSDDSRRRQQTPNIKAMVPADFGVATPSSAASPFPWTTSTNLDAEKPVGVTVTVDKEEVAVNVDKEEAGTVFGNSSNAELGISSNSIKEDSPIVQ